MTVLFNIFMRQTLTDDFWELHKNMNCAFPLSKQQAVDADPKAIQQINKTVNLDQAGETIMYFIIE